VEDPGDFVRIEVESALERDIPIIPLLVDDATMPGEDQLPPSLQMLPYRNGLRVRPDPDFPGDMARLISALSKMKARQPSQSERPAPVSRVRLPQPDDSGPRPRRVGPYTAAASVAVLTILIAFGMYMIGPKMDQKVQLTNPRPDSSDTRPVPNNPRSGTFQDAINPWFVVQRPDSSDTRPVPNNPRSGTSEPIILSTQDIKTETRPVSEPPKTLTNTLGMKLVLIPAGEFLMGSPDEDKDAEDDEKPQHRVKISKPFYLGATEVTVGQFGRVVESAGYRTEAETDGKGGWGWNEQAKKFEGFDPKHSWRFTGFEQTDEHPVVNVTWNDAIAFCNELSKLEGLKPYYRIGAGEQSGGDRYRLPTEAEWEYACRAGSTTKYGFGDDASELGQYAWYEGNSGLKTHPVGQKRPNGFGLFDMHGNVWEWCWDWYDSRYYSQSPDADPAGPSRLSIRVFRGGGWDDDPRSVRSANRYRDTPVSRNGLLGFRVARVQSGH
jgi:formylglycine-generating enzyme required for sulfatase activity